MNPESRQARILAASWLALVIIALVGLSTREAVIFCIASAVLFVAMHYILGWALDLSSHEVQQSLTTPDIERARSVPPDTPRGLSEKSFSHLAELADVGLVHASTDGQIEFASRRARELLDLDVSLAPSQTWLQAFESIRAHFSPDTTSSGAVQVLSTEGPRTLSLKAHPVHDDDWSGILVQVRDRKLLDALESDMRLASRHRVLNHIYLGVAHDLKGPLNAVMLTIEGLRADIEDGSGTEKDLLDRLDVIKDELTRHHCALEALLAETAPERTERATFDLRDKVARVVRLIQPQLRHQRIELDVKGDTPAPVTAIQDRIREALLAMVINAMEAMPNGGRLAISTSRHESTCSIELQDTGGGIPDEIVGRIFDLRFTTKDTGTGIGLSTARSIIESEHGSIELVRTGADGTTFRVNLPVAGTE